MAKDESRIKNNEASDSRKSNFGAKSGVAKNLRESDSSPAAQNDKITVRAYLKELRLAPRKVAVVASLVRGRRVDDALIILAHTPRRSAKSLAKVISSARANATNNHNLTPDSLKIATLSVTAGARLKRFRPVSRGMAHPFQKRTSNILVEIIGEIKAKKVAKAPDEARNTNNDTRDSQESNADNSGKKGEK